MNLVFLNPSGQLGGAERSLLDILASLREAEPAWRLTLIVTGEGPLVTRARSLGVSVLILSFPARVARLGDSRDGSRSRIGASLARRFGLLVGIPSAFGYSWRLRRLLRRLAPDVVHSNGFKMHVLGAWTIPRGVGIVWHVHDYVGNRPIMSRLLRAHISHCSAVVANSHSVARDVRSVCGDRVPVTVVYNGVDLYRFSPSGPVLDLDALAQIPAPAPETVRVGLVATLGWWKGHETFLNAIALLPTELPVRAYIVGGAVYETGGSQYSLEELRRLARDLGIGDRVGFTDFVEESAAAMRGLDIVVHASTEPEPFGLVIVEAMACGRPVVVSGAGGAAELIRAGENALVHSPGDAVGLAEALEMLIRHPKQRSQLGECGRRSAEARFDRARLATELVPIYRAVVSASS